MTEERERRQGKDTLPSCVYSTYIFLQVDVCIGSDQNLDNNDMTILSS